MTPTKVSDIKEVHVGLPFKHAIHLIVSDQNGQENALLLI